MTYLSVPVIIYHEVLIVIITVEDVCGYVRCLDVVEN